jgi:hypothetical protein
VIINNFNEFNMSFEQSPIEPSNEGSIDKEKKALEEVQEQIIETVKKTRRKAAKKAENETHVEEVENTESHAETTPQESEIKPDMSLEELAKLAKKLGMSEQEAEELVEKRRELIKKHSDYIWEARQNLADIDNDIWVLTVEKDTNETDEEYASRKDERDIGTLSEAVKKGLVSLKEFNDYKSAKEAIENAEKNGSDQKLVEKLKIVLEAKENEFADKMIQYINEEHNEREILKAKIANDLSSRTGIIERQIADVDELITDTPENIAKKKGLMKELIDSVRKVWLGKDGLLGEKTEDGYHKESEDGRYGKRLSNSRKAKAELEEKREKERNKERDNFLEDLRVSIGRISAKHKQIFDNLGKVLTKEDHAELLEIMSNTNYTIKPNDFERINSIRKTIVEHILLEEKLVLKDPNYIVPWAKIDSGYTRDIGFLLDAQTNEILNFYKKETEESDPVQTNLTENEIKISQLRGENTVFKVLIGKKETSAIRTAFEDRKYADHSGKFKELKEQYLKNQEAEKKREEQKLKNIESKKQERVEIERTVHEALKDDFFDFAIPVFEGKKIVEKHPVAIRFESYVSDKKTLMLKVVEIIDKRPKSKDAIKPKEIEGFTLGRSFDLETLSGAPQWIKDGLNDDAKDKIASNLLIKESQK